MRTVAVTSRTLGSWPTIRISLTPWYVAVHGALPRARSLRLHVLGQHRRGVDLLIDTIEVVLDLSRRESAQPQAESQRSNVEFHRGQAIQDSVSKSSIAIARDGLFH